MRWHVPPSPTAACTRAVRAGQRRRMMRMPRERLALFTRLHDLGCNRAQLGVHIDRRTLCERGMCQVEKISGGVDVWVRVGCCSSG